MRELKGRHRVWIGLATLLAMTLFAAWPWLASVPRKFEPLEKYLIYDGIGPKVEMAHGEPSAWHRPKSRWELLLCDDYRIQFPRTKVVDRPSRPKSPRRSVPAAVFNDEDELTDFVIDVGDHFEHPKSFDDLAKALNGNLATRASVFFQCKSMFQKPYYGFVPAGACLYRVDRELFHEPIAALTVIQNGERVNVTLESPKASEVFLVAGAGAYNARRAAYQRKPPVALGLEEYWAVVYMGVGSGGGDQFHLDRIKVGPTSAEISIYERQQFISSGYEAYWFLVPLGPLADGPYEVTIRDATGGEARLSTAVDLHRETESDRAGLNQDATLPTRKSQLYQ